jgi:hypothetical protein
MTQKHGTLHQNCGLVPIGTGGGAPSSGSSPCVIWCPAKPGFFLGGGGGGAGPFFVAAAASAPANPPDELASDPAPDPGALPPAAAILSRTPYFSSRLPAVRTPAATWSPCRWRKLLNVDAAAGASVMDTELGSLWKAACFCAKVVPWVGGGEGVLVLGPVR